MAQDPSSADGVFDYVIVGAGASGCVVAEKLSADPTVSVLLVEAGPENSWSMIHIPKGFQKLMGTQSHAYTYTADPGPGGKNTSETWVRGKMIGGSSSINGMLYCRGFPQDYDEWVNDRGLPGWGWDKIGAIYREMEDHELGGTDFRGQGGPLHISVSKNRVPYFERLFESARKIGVPTFEDVNEPRLEGLGYTPTNIYKGRRWSAAKAFLDRARPRPNIKIVTDTPVERILFEGRRAVGVQGRASGRRVTYRARREIILTLGAIETPKLMQLSGVGPAELLHRHGIDVVLDRAMVGANMREHLILTMQYRLAGDFSQNKYYSGWRLGMEMLRYVLRHDGLLACPAYDSIGYVRSSDKVDRPDVMLVTGPISMDLERWEGFGKGIPLEKEPGAQMIVYNMRPESKGRCEIRSADPAAPPNITHNCLSDPRDRETAIAIVRFVRKLMAQSPIKEMIVKETLPGPEIETDEDILAAYSRLSGPGYHAAGTCAMGVEEDAVTDGRARVKGIEGLRVADLSIFPTLVSGATHGPTMAAAHRVAAFIVEDAKAQPAKVARPAA